jgi:hypothetical protein
MRPTAEQQRVADSAAGKSDWQRWGTYVSDRAWGTVREDYSADGSAWEYFPHDHARSRAYRWNEDALAGFCDREQHLCLGLALWNERDPILKERLFGLSNREGNHGEDVKEYFFYLDNTPTHAYARMLYKYPQVAFPYADLVAENGRRGAHEPEYELFDALGEAFRERRYFDVFVEYAKQDAEDILCRIEVINRGPAPAPIHVLPHLWYRNTWSWTHDAVRHTIRAVGSGAARTSHPVLGERWWYVEADGAPAVDMMFTENDTNAERLFNAPNEIPYVKDGINDAVVLGCRDRVHASSGSKVAAGVHALVQPGASFIVRARLTPRPRTRPFGNFEAAVEKRAREADDFYARLHAAHLTGDERLVQRQAFAGLLWSKQFYHFDVHHWLTGDPAQPPPPAERWNGRNRDWAMHLRNADVVLMPDKWEYPWYASWDLAFHVVVMAMIDPDFAKEQLLLLTLPRFQHPYGTVPAFEWDFGAVNPPVLAWAALQVFYLDRAHRDKGDHLFLASMFDSLMLMLGWWMNRKDSEGRGIFGGGFLGLDNIGPFDRDHLPTGRSLEQSDGTGWMAMFQLNMSAIAAELSIVNPRYAQHLQRFGQHIAILGKVLQQTAAGGMGLWNDEEKFYFDVMRHGTQRVPLKVYSMVGLVPLFAVVVVDQAMLHELGDAVRNANEEFNRRQYLRAILPGWVVPGKDDTRLLSVVDRGRLINVMTRVLDEREFVSDYGVRSMSRAHLDDPFRFFVDGERYEVSYVPGESDNHVFGGNSNWRGPIWFPMNFLLIQSIARFGRYYGDAFTLECPLGSGKFMTLAEIADDLARRLTRIFARDEARGGRRPVFGDNEHFQQDEHCRDYVPFSEYFHGETGEGLGASHQTGWTALVALLLQFKGDLCFETALRTKAAKGADGSADIDRVVRAGMKLKRTPQVNQQRQRGWGPARIKEKEALS